MIKLKAEKRGPHCELIVENFYGNRLYSGFLDEKEAVDVACQLIRAAEELLPITCSSEKVVLASIREELEK